MTFKCYKNETNKEYGENIAELEDMISASREDNYETDDFEDSDDK